jgi:hypothetical protein
VVHTGLTGASLSIQGDVKGINNLSNDTRPSLRYRFYEETGMWRFANRPKLYVLLRFAIAASYILLGIVASLLLVLPLDEPRPILPAEADRVLNVVLKVVALALLFLAIRGLLWIGRRSVPRELEAFEREPIMPSS